jgi:energy-converting hydrogenase Eha subunit B
MKSVLLDHPAWYVAGALLGGCVIALRLLLNARLGVTGGYADVFQHVRARDPRLGSVASMVATATFVATAIAVSFVIKGLT